MAPQLKLRTMNDERLDAERVRLEHERRDLERDAGPFKEVALERAERMSQMAAVRLEALVSGFEHVPDDPGFHGVDELAKLYVVSSEGFADRLRAAIDSAVGYSDVTRAEHEAKVAKITTQLEAIALEVERRRRYAAVVQAQRELSEIDA